MHMNAHVSHIKQLYINIYTSYRVEHRKCMSTCVHENAIHTIYRKLCMRKECEHLWMQMPPLGPRRRQNWSQNLTRFMAEERAGFGRYKNDKPCKAAEIPGGSNEGIFLGVIPAFGFKGFLITSGLDMHLREKRWLQLLRLAEGSIFYV